MPLAFPRVGQRLFMCPWGKGNVVAVGVHRLNCFAEGQHLEILTWEISVHVIEGPSAIKSLKSVRKCVALPHKIVCTSHNFVGRIRANMRKIQLKISDLARVADISRFQVDGLLKDVFSNRPLGMKASGSHRSFTPQELLVFAVAYEIEQKYGVKRSTLALAGEQLRQALTGPRKASRESRLVVTFDPATATYLDPGVPAAEGIVVQLGPLFEKVDEYLGVSGSRRKSTAILPLRPVIATARRGGSRR